MDSIVEQLIDIYYTEEWWHEFKMPYGDAYAYHESRLKSGAIYAYVDGGVALGYYERYCIGNTCFLHNVWVRGDQRGGKVFRALYKHFFSHLPRGIVKIVGTKQKLGGIMRERKIYGKY